MGFGELTTHGRCSVRMHEGGLRSVEGARSTPAKGGSA